MAEHGDPKTPAETPDDDGQSSLGHDHSLDDLIGFTSPSSLAGRERPIAAEPEPESDPASDSQDHLFEAELTPEPEPGPEHDYASEPLTAPEEPVFVRPLEPEPDPDPQFETDPVVAPEPEAEVEPERDLFAVPPPRVSTPEVRPAPAVQPAPAPAPAAEPPAWAMETPVPRKPAFGRADTPAEPPEGAMGLYTIYALILFAVPTLGVSAVIALLAVTGRAEPRQALALSHHIYQKRTLWISAIAAALGVVLIAVNLGVFVLFLLAVWMIVRGAAGILALSVNRPIKRPKHWLV